MRFIIFFFLLLLPFTAFAQTIPPSIIQDPGSRFLNEERRQRDQQLLERPPSQIQIERPKAEEKAATGPCFQIKKIVLKDAVKLSEKQITALTSPYKNTCMGLGDINKLIHDITNTYIDMGYITTRAYIPPQNLGNGTLQLVIVQGVIEDIKLNENTTREDRWRTLTAMPGLKGDILNLKDLEQGLDQMNRLSSSNAKLQLWPGTKTGESVVSIKDAKHDNLRGYINYDNFGQETTGENRIRLTVEKDNLIGINDTYALHYIGSRDTNALALTASVPYGYWTFSVDSSYSEYFSLIDASAELFGTSWNNSFKADRVVWRGKDTKTSLYAVLNPKDSSRLINDINLAPQPLTVGRLGVTQLVRTDSSVWNAEGTYSRGLTILDASRDPDDITSDTPHAQFNKVDGSINYYRPYSFGAFRSSLVGQYSWDSLYSSEQIFMGDSTTVRGFIGTEATGDNGVYSRNEFAFNLPASYKEHLPESIANTLQPYAFLDGGYAELNAGNIQQSLAGTGAGVRFGYRNLSGDLSLAVPLYSSDTVDKDDGFAVYVSLGYKLF